MKKREKQPTGETCSFVFFPLKKIFCVSAMKEGEKLRSGDTCTYVFFLTFMLFYCCSIICVATHKLYKYISYLSVIICIKLHRLYVLRLPYLFFRLSQHKNLLAAGYILYNNVSTLQLRISCAANNNTVHLIF